MFKWLREQGDIRPGAGVLVNVQSEHARTPLLAPRRLMLQRGCCELGVTRAEAKEPVRRASVSCRVFYGLAVLVLDRCR